MKFLPPRRGLLLGLLAGLLLAAAPLTGARAAACNDLDDRGYAQILTLNLLFSEFEQRDVRFQAIATFLAGLADPVDFILLQEVVGGALAGTDNSAADLREVLEVTTGEDYELRTVFETGLPGVLTNSNAILSRCDIRFHFARFLPPSSETFEFGDLTIPVTRNVMMVRVKVPGFGRLNLYNTHLCAGDCTVPELAEQAEAATDFVKDVERFFSFFRRRPHILGGDFNQDNFRGSSAPGVFGPELFIYDRIVSGEDFRDLYADAIGLPLNQLCENEAAADEHCTVGVSTLDGNNARRIDYLFARGFGPVIDGRVIFNNEVDGGIGPGVSDHAGVLVRVNLPGSNVTLTAGP